MHQLDPATFLFLLHFPVITRGLAQREQQILLETPGRKRKRARERKRRSGETLSWQLPFIGQKRSRKKLKQIVRLRASQKVDVVVV